jgi:hypothetical protein
MKLTLKGLGEYFKLLPTIVQNIDGILEGTINQVKLELNMLPEEEQAEIARRRVICATCPFSSSNAATQLLYKSDRFDEHCILCGCTITRKTADLRSNCGIDCCNANPITDCKCKDKNLKQYNQTTNTNLEPKWKAFKNQKDEQQE